MIQYSLVPKLSWYLIRKPGKMGRPVNTHAGHRAGGLGQWARQERVLLGQEESLLFALMREIPQESQVKPQL